MSTKLTKKQKRSKKRQIQRKYENEQRIERIQNNKRLEEMRQQIQQQQHIQGGKISPQEFNPDRQLKMMDPNTPEEIKDFVINYVADRNGCGYYRCIWPFELLATYRNFMSMNSFVYQHDLNILKSVSCFRFQRQATNVQRQIWDMYRQYKHQHGFRYNLQYEIDDLLMEIEPHNKIAYDFFDEEKKRNHMHMLHTSDSITFSTDALKEIYVRDYGVNPNKIQVVKNYLPQFMYALPYRNAPKDFTKNKPRVFWSGSGSHVGKGGDLDFIIPLVEKTVDEYQWVFQGVVPPELYDYVKAGKIEFMQWAPTYGLANLQFYKASPDIYLAPLKPSKFNSAKSDLKFLEASALGAACITTSFSGTEWKSPYEDVAEICLEPDADIWKSMIDHLISEPDYYTQVIKEQYNFLNSRWMESNLDQWVIATRFKG